MPVSPVRLAQAQGEAADRPRRREVRQGVAQQEGQALVLADGFPKDQAMLPAPARFQLGLQGQLPHRSAGERGPHAREELPGDGDHHVDAGDRRLEQRGCLQGLRQLSGPQRLIVDPVGKLPDTFAREAELAHELGKGDLGHVADPVEAQELKAGDGFGCHRQHQSA